MRREKKYPAEHLGGKKYPAHQVAWKKNLNSPPPPPPPSRVKWSAPKVHLHCITCFTDAFDKEYRRAYKRLFESKNYSDLLGPEDRNPPARAVYCRRTFDTPTLQPRLPQYLVSSFT